MEPEGCGQTTSIHEPSEIAIEHLNSRNYQGKSSKFSTRNRACSVS